MSLTAWNSALGTHQGRIAPTEATPPEGAFVFVLGSDSPGHFFKLKPGDFSEVAQVADFGDTTLLRARVTVRPPAFVPSGLRWVLSVRIDGAEYAQVGIAVGRERFLSDVAANVSKLSGNHQLAFRLALVGSGTEVYEVELPGVYLDAILLDPTPATPVIINRSPEPNENQVPINEVVALEITDVGASGLDTAQTQVFVAGLLTFSGGVFEPGFDGPLSTATLTRPDTFRIVIDAFAPFESLQVVPVRVVSKTMDGQNALDAAWQFTSEDLTAPKLVAAQARAPKRIRISFDENVKQVNALAPDDALNPSLYGLERLSFPAVTPSVVGVEPVSNSAFELLTDIELTPNARYQVVAVGVADVFDNVVAAPNNRAEFLGFVPAQPLRRRFDLFRLLPEMNRREDETSDLRRFLLCLQEVTNLLLSDVDSFPNIFDADVAPESFVDLMLKDLGNPFPFDLSLTDKRRLLNILVAIYREKGTGIGIQNAVRFFLGVEVDVLSYAGEALLLGESLLGEDWILSASTSFSAYAFDVASPRALAAEERLRIFTITDYMKPAHTHFRVVEPVIPEVIEHIELGLSELGASWLLHGGANGQ